ncbi:hypothetical protein DIDNDMLP_00499 [Klebsiella phage KP13-7]|nr:hypothetical protein DIDNDMLP_00499 [Klebsiella phage KP13-7]
MLNEFKSGITVPNGYVYTSKTGARYVFLECMWFNESNMMLVDPQKYGNMYLSAVAQINEYNSSSNEYKIGDTYNKDNKTCVFLGESRFITENGIIINEDDENTIQVPNGIRITSKNGNVYQKKDGTWFDIKTKKTLNSSAAQSVERSAQKMIQTHNSNEDNIKIGSTVTSKSNKTYTYLGGDRFMDADGRLLPKSTAQSLIQKHKDEKSSGKAEDEQESGSSDDTSTDTTTTTDTNTTDNTNSSGDTSGGTGETDNQSSDNPMQELADKINASPYARKIKVLLTRADKVSLLAADIFLSGKREEVTQFIKSLNNNNE